MARRQDMEAQVELLEARVKELNAQLETYRSREEAVVYALSEVKETASRRISEAEERARQIIKDAEAQKLLIQKQSSTMEREAAVRANAIVEDAQREAAETLSNMQDAAGEVEEQLKQLNYALRETAKRAYSQAEEFAKAVDALRMEAIADMPLEDAQKEPVANRPAIQRPAAAPSYQPPAYKPVEPQPAAAPQPAAVYQPEAKIEPVKSVPALDMDIDEFLKNATEEMQAIKKSLAPEAPKAEPKAEAKVESFDKIDIESIINEEPQVELDDDKFENKIVSAQPQKAGEAQITFNAIKAETGEYENPQKVLHGIYQLQGRVMPVDMGGEEKIEESPAPPVRQAVVQEPQAKPIERPVEIPAEVKAEAPKAEPHMVNNVELPTLDEIMGVSAKSEPVREERLWTVDEVIGQSQNAASAPKLESPAAEFMRPAPNTDPSAPADTAGIGGESQLDDLLSEIMGKPQQKKSPKGGRDGVDLDSLLDEIIGN